MTSEPDLQEAERQQIAQLFNDSCGEIAEAMSRLSAADFSVFLTCLSLMKPGDRYQFRTSHGSPNQAILAAMEDVWCVQLTGTQVIAPGFSISDYELTDLGRSLLINFVRDATQRRSKRESTG